MAITFAQAQNALQNPLAFSGLTAQQQADVVTLLKNGVQGFSAPQRAFFANCWFTPTQAQIDAMNALLPPQTRLSARPIGGVLYLCSDILTDCMTVGSTYHAVLPILKDVPMQFSTVVADDVAAKQAAAIAARNLG